MAWEFSQVGFITHSCLASLLTDFSLREMVVAAWTYQPYSAPSRRPLLSQSQVRRIVCLGRWGVYLIIAMGDETKEGMILLFYMFMIYWICCIAHGAYAMDSSRSNSSFIGYE